MLAQQQPVAHQRGQQRFRLGIEALLPCRQVLRVLGLKRVLCPFVLEKLVQHELIDLLAIDPQRDGPR